MQKDLFLRLVVSADSVVSPSCGTSCFGGGTATYPAATTPSATLTVPGAGGTLGAIATFTTSAAVFSNAHVQGEIIGTDLGGHGSDERHRRGHPAVLVDGPGDGDLEDQRVPLAVVYTLLPPEQVHILQTTEWVDKFTSVTRPGRSASPTSSPTAR